MILWGPRMLGSYQGLFPGLHEGETCVCTQQRCASERAWGSRLLPPSCLSALLWEHLEETKHLTNAKQGPEFSRWLSWSSEQFFRNW